MGHNTFFECTILIFSLSFHEICFAMNYEVTNEAANTPGGMNFTEKVGIRYAKQVMWASNIFIWNTVFEQYTLEDRKLLDTVELYLKDFEGEFDAIAWGNNKINFSVHGFEDKMSKRDFTAIMYHEMTHVFQWNGEGLTPDGLIEGVADYTVIRANLVDPSYLKPGQGDRWDQGYDVTARFLEYCNTITPSFTAKLNKMMRTTYDVSFFEDLTGKPVEQLWEDFKAYYGQEI